MEDALRAWPRGLLVPESAGGLELGVLDAAVIAEALGHHVTPAPFLGTAVLFPRALAAAAKATSPPGKGG